MRRGPWTTKTGRLTAQQYVCASNIFSRSVCIESDGPATEDFGHLTYPYGCGVGSVDDGTTPDRSSNGVGTIRASRPIEPWPACLVPNPRLEQFWKLLRKNNGRNGRFERDAWRCRRVPFIRLVVRPAGSPKAVIVARISRPLRRLNCSGRFLEGFWNFTGTG